MWEGLRKGLFTEIPIGTGGILLGVSPKTTANATFVAVNYNIIQ